MDLDDLVKVDGLIQSASAFCGHQYDLPVHRVNLLHCVGDRFVTAASLVLVRDENGEADFRMLAIIDHIGDQAELLIQPFQFVAFQVNLCVGLTLLLGYHIAITGESIKSGKLCGPVVERHVRTGGRLPMRMIDDVRIDVSSVGLAFF